jgi:hypothetical protein
VALQEARDSLGGRFLHFLAGPRLAVFLFGAIALCALPGTFGSDRSWYTALPFRVLLGLLGLNLLACSVRRWRGLSWPVRLMHGGILVTLAGTLLTASGFVATVNVYEGGATDTAYRWDRQRDEPLGLTLAVTRINREYRPVPLKVGVLRGAERVGLFPLVTGESFSLAEFRVTAEAIDIPAKALTLAVHQGGRLLGRVSTVGESTLPAGFPYDFKLVAYRDPALQRLWVDLQLRQGEAVLASGTAEVNHPFSWQGLDFYHIQTDRTPAGAPYAGIQIVRDPGRPVVFAGFAVVGLGAVLALLKRFRSSSGGNGPC